MRPGALAAHVRRVVPLALIGLLFLPLPAWAGGLRIFQIQGAGMVSPWRGRFVRHVPGIVTLVRHHGFFMQDPDGDGDPATSDGFFVYTRHPPTVKLGETVAVDGRVREYRPGGRHSANLSMTEIHASRVGAITSPFHQPGVRPRVLGADGEMPPTEVIAAATWHADAPRIDGLHFYESLEGMLVEIHAPQALSPVNRYGELWVVPDRGRGATGMNAMGGITVRSLPGGTDFNPERLLLNPPRGAGTADISIGQVLTTVRGVVDYDYGNYQVRLLRAPRLSASQPARAATTTAAVGARNTLSIATYNVDNLDPNDRDGDHDVAEGRFRRLAHQIVRDLGAPEIIALQEIQDSDGASNSRSTSAEATLRRLCFEIHAAGGPHYDWAGIDPQRGRDGGQPGGNIRPVLLYDPARVRFNAIRGGTGVVATLHVAHAGFRLSPNPARVAPGAPAFYHSRKPLVASFEVSGQRWLVIDNHFTSRRGSTPLYGRRQPPLIGGARQRRAQAEELRKFLAPLENNDGGARVIVLGDFNDYAFSAGLAPLTRAPPAGLGLVDALHTLSPAARFSYVYQGNAQDLDHVFLSAPMARSAIARIVHVNTGAVRGASDHDPVLVTIRARQ